VVCDVVADQAHAFDAVDPGLATEPGRCHSPNTVAAMFSARAGPIAFATRSYDSGIWEGNHFRSRLGSGRSSSDLGSV